LGYPGNPFSFYGEHIMKTRRIFIPIFILLTILALGLTACGPATATALPIATGKNAAPTVQPTATSNVSTSNASATPASGVAQSLQTATAKHVQAALTILFGLDPNQPSLSSFHFEAVNLSPAWLGEMIVQVQDNMVADVQGKDVHYTERLNMPGQATNTRGAYIISNQEYKEVEGQVGQATANSLTWDMWSLTPELLIVIGSAGATLAGTETLEGRSVEVYDLIGDGTALSGATGMALPASFVSGKVWIDQQTGALLKAELEYMADAKDSSGNIKGNGAGRLQINVTLIDQVTVKLPGN
jgi:hypothetical protein